MTLEEYRIQHSMLIEQYQLIEFDLEGLCAFISGEPFREVIREIEKDAIGGVVREIKRIEDQRNIAVFSEDEYLELDRIRERRNFWCHECYTEPYDRRSGVPRNAALLDKDLRDAERILRYLRKIKDIYAEEYHENKA